MAPNSAPNCLQTAVQSVQWTYCLFWQLCPQQRILVWEDGYYNGSIKTRKTVQPMDVSTEESSLHRSQQLRELYDSLSVTDPNPRRPSPSAALSPEDLTDSEWFYLMSLSFSFPPGVGLPGKAYAKRKHVWLTGASEVDSKVFSRAILAKSAGVQTVLCIPLLQLDGVVELGTTEKVQEDLGFVQRVKSFFIDHTLSLPQKPALSGHSTSNPACMSPTMQAMDTPVPAVDPQANAVDQMDEEEEEEDDDDNEEDEEEEAKSDAEAETGRNSRFSSVHNLQAMAKGLISTEAPDHAVAEPSELMHLDLSEDIRLGSPDDGSNNLDSDFHLLADRQGQVDSFAAEWTPALELQDHNPLSNCLQLLASGPLFPTPPLEELPQEDTHYSHTVTTILHQHATGWSYSSTMGYAIHSTQSAFNKWTPNLLTEATSQSQWVLKYVLFTAPFLHANSNKSRDSDGAAESTTTQSHKGTPQDEVSANHVLAERRRREKLNERFIILRSLVPFVTKMDKASILGDTIEYLKQLLKKIQDLEERARHVVLDQRPSKEVVGIGPSNKRKLRRMVEGGAGEGEGMEAPKNMGVQVEVSIIESDALVELQCPYREGLLLDMMQVLRDLRVEITTVQSSLNKGSFAVEMRAKVKENVINGKKVSIMEVKRAINQIIPHQN